MLHQKRILRARPRPAMRPAIFAAAIALLASPAAANERLQDCQVEPDRETTQPSAANRENLAKTSECDGLLVPAPVGDGELVRPAPAAGETPVIAPEELPAQPPQE